MYYIDSQDIRYNGISHFNLDEHTKFPEIALKSKFNSDPNINDEIPDFLIEYLTISSPLVFSGEEVIMHELKMNYIHEYIKKLSSKIIDLIKSDQDNLVEIKKYENKLLEFLNILRNFLSFIFHGSSFHKHFVVYSDELLQLLLYTDNWELIHNIFFMLKINNITIPSNICFLERSLKLIESRYILAYIERFFFKQKIVNNAINPYYKHFLNDKKFIESKKGIESFVTDLQCSSNEPESESCSLSGKFKSKEPNGIPESFEIQNFNEVYPKTKHSFHILQEILKEKNHEDLRETDFEMFVHLNYSIKFLKQNDEPFKGINYLICQMVLTTLRYSPTYYYNNDINYDIYHYQNYVAVFLFCPLIVTKEKNYLKNLLRSFEYSSLSQIIKNYKDSEGFYRYLTKKICEVSNELLLAYSDDYEIIDLIFFNLVVSCYDLLNSNTNDIKFYEHLLPFIKGFFEKHFVKNEEFQKDPILQLSNQFISRIFLDMCHMICTMNMQLDTVFFFEEINQIYNKIIETIMAHDFSDLKLKYPKIYCFQTIFTFLSPVIKDARNKKEKCKTLTFKNLLLKVKACKNQESFLFYGYFIVQFLEQIKENHKDITDLTDEKSALFEIVEELYLKQNVYLSYECFSLCDEWNSQDLDKLPTLDDLEKNERAFKNCEIYFKIYFRVSLLIGNKKNQPYIRSVFKNYEPLITKVLFNYYKEIHTKYIIPDINDLKEMGKQFKSDLDNQAIYKIYLNFMIFKYRKLKRGITKLIYNFKDNINNEFSESELNLVIDSINEVFSHPLMLPIREKYYHKYSLNYSNYQNEEKKKISCCTYVFNKILDHFDNFVKSYRNLKEICKKNDIILLDFFSNKKKFSHYYWSRKFNDQLAEFYLNVFQKVDFFEICDDLQSLGKMKFLLYFLKAVNIENPEYENYLKLGQKIEGVFSEILSDFSQDYLKSQISEYEFYNKNNLWDYSSMSSSREDNQYYYYVACFSNNYSKSLMKGYKLVNRILNLPKRLYRFAMNNFSEQDKEKKNKLEKFIKDLIKNLTKKYSEKDLTKLNLVEANPVLVYNTLMSALLSNIINNFIAEHLGGYFAKSRKYLKKITDFNKSLVEFCASYKIDNKISKKAEVSFDLFVKVANLHAIVIYYNGQGVYYIESVLKSVCNNLTSKALLDKIDSRLPLYKEWFDSVGLIDNILEKYNWIYKISDSSTYNTFENTEQGKKQKENHFKVYQIAGQSALSQLIKQNYPASDFSYLFNILRNLYRVLCELEIETLNRKIIYLKFTETIQKMFDFFNLATFDLKEESGLYKEIQLEVLNEKEKTEKNVCNIFKFEVDLNGLTLTKQISIFTHIFITYAHFTNWNDSYPNCTESFKKLLTTITFTRKIILFLFNLFQKIQENNLFEENKEAFYFLLSKTMSPFSENFSKQLPEQNRLEYFAENMEIVKKYIKIYLSPENTNFDHNDFCSLLKIVLYIIGDPILKTDKNKAKIIFDDVKNIIINLGIVRINYYASYAEINFFYFLTIFEKMIEFYDENENLQRINIELKLKDLFYDNYSSKQKTSIKLEDLSENSDLATDFNFNGKLFYEVFHKLCEFSNEENKTIVLRPGTDLEKFNSSEELKISKEIPLFVNFLLDSIISSIGDIIKKMVTCDENKSQESPYLFSINHSLGLGLLRYLIKRYPSLIIYVLNYDVSIEIIEKYYKDFTELYEKIKESLKINNSSNINLIDFLFLTYPYNGSFSQQIFSILISSNYNYKSFEVNGVKTLASSSILWRYEIFSRILNEYKSILETKLVTTNLNAFLQLHHLQIIVINVIQGSKKFNKAFINYDDTFNKRLYEFCLTTLNIFSNSMHLTLLKRNGVFYSLCQKTHSRIIKMSIFRKKNSQNETKDMKYYKFYTWKNFKELIASTADNKFCSKSSELPSLKSYIFQTSLDYFSNTNYIKVENPEYFSLIQSKIVKSIQKIQNYYSNIRDNFDYSPYNRIYKNGVCSLAFLWLDELKPNLSLFDFNHEKLCYNKGITFTFYNTLFNNSAITYISNFDDSLIDHMHKSNSNPENPVENLSQLVTAMIDSLKPNELVINPPPVQLAEEIKEVKIEEPQPQNSSQEESKVEESSKPVTEPIFEEKKEPEAATAVVINYDFTSKGYPADSLTLYEIDKSYFDGLDETSKLEVLKTEQKKYEEKQAAEKGIKLYDFVGNGFPVDALTLYSIDKEFFEGLPDDLKKDALEQARTEYQKKEAEKEAALKEKEKNEALNKKLRILAIRENAILSQISKEKGIIKNENISEEDWTKLCSSINELEEQSKKNLLKKLPYDLIKALPKELKSEAKKIRKNCVDFYHKRIVPKEGADSCSSSLRTISEEDLNNDDIFENTASILELVEENKEDEKILFDDFEKNEEYEKIFNDLEFYDDLPELDEETLINLTNILNSFDQNDSDYATCFRKYLRSLALIPKNAYKLIDSFGFLLTFYKEYEKALHEENADSIKKTKFYEKTLRFAISLTGENLKISTSDIEKQAAEFFNFLISKKIALPLLCNSFTYGCTALVFENSTYQSSSVIQEMRTVLSQRKLDVKKETVLEKILKYYTDNSGSLEIMKNINNILVFKEDLKENSKVKYPKISTNMTRLFFIEPFSNKMDLSTFRNNFEIFSDIIANNCEGMINLALKNISKEIEKYSKDSITKKEKILEFKKTNSIVKDISSMSDQDKRNSHWGSVHSIIEEKYYDIRYLRRDARGVLNKLKLYIHKFAKKEAKKKVDQSLDPVALKEAKRKEFYIIIAEIIKTINQKIHENDIILNFFRDYFSLCFVILNVIGTDFTKDHYYAGESFAKTRHIFKLFIDFYSFLNPLEQEYQVKKEVKEVESVNRQSIPKLSKLQTRGPEEEEKKEFKFKSEKIGKIFGAFARKTDIDNSFKNTITLAYGSFSFFIEQFLQYGLNNYGRISKAYFYYIKKAPSEQSLNSNIKFYYLSYLAKDNAKKKSSNDGSERITLDRNAIWQSTLEFILSKTPAEFTRFRLNVEFQNESGIDAGGLTREWLSLLVKEVFNPDFGLFKASENKISYQPNPLSYVVPDHLLHFRMLGRLIAKAIIEKWNIEVYFVKSFLKHILQKTLYINDLQDVDAELYNSMKWVLENPVDDMGFVFSYEKKEFDNIKMVELIENGSQVEVVDSNKKEFVKAMAYAKMAKEIDIQTEAMIEGITEIIPAEALPIINEKDLGLRLAGAPAIDVDEMQKYCIYNAYSKDQNIVKWLFEILREFDENMKAKFLFYILGCFRVPIGGFKFFPMKISSLSDVKSLPIAHTCFGQIDMPNYSTKEILKEKLILAITEGGGTGFFFG